MCNHYQQPNVKLMQNYLTENLKLPLANQQLEHTIYASKKDIFPKKEALFLLKSPTGKVGFMPKSWGYPNPFNNKNVLVNARLEKYIQPRSMWHNSIPGIIIANQFFEAGPATYTANNGKTYKEQFSFTQKNSPLTFIAGIYEKDHFAMITTQPTPLYAQVHDRMPLVLAENNLNAWLSGEISVIKNHNLVNLEKVKLPYRS
ncbi:SOS response-associated peptidase family protein [Lactobacillus sp.]|uniref:SOS response-associated peptidase family protein n=1 Tax=Lactobacillus sp. TaxID=1591 RepID=UPI001989AC67|nr:SOS response-associated peptidase family protein [Lactobacillus sp.]MBD5429882.1 DUF159 family protein [Lactobacillus sp.]